MVEGARLESVYTGNRIKGSNPFLSAIIDSFISFFRTINHIKENYNNIQQEMKKNKLPTKDEFLKRFSELISKLD